ncbi:MAG: patatin-like phospholipase family protein [Alphaproteobacteria bacterium]|nr:patatin-like phospholipase family protein [Alphaproteobacteria bacterium]
MSNRSGPGTGVQSGTQQGDLQDPVIRDVEVPERVRDEATGAMGPGLRRSKRPHHQKPRTLNLALQGGGSHGAFTWGVLDKLLEDGRIEFEAISGTSAGAMNAIVMASGWADDGRRGARAALDKFWDRIADVGRSSPIQRTVIDRLMGNWRVDMSPGFMMMDMMNRVLSPYQLNPLNINPLRDVLGDVVDVQNACHASGIKLFFSATNVRSGKIKVFGNKDITLDAVMASACLPLMFQAIEIDGEAYYDGGYMGNPAIFPLAYNADCRDVLIVQINPLYRDHVPNTAREILDRVNEITFNSTLMREMRAVHFVNRLIAGGKLDPEAYRMTRIHMIQDAAQMGELAASSKMNAERAFLSHLKEIGRQSAESWLDAHFDCIGHESSIDVRKIFL